MATKRYTQEQLIDAIKTSKTYKEVLKVLGMKNTHNLEFIRKAVKTYNIDTSHMYSSTKGVGCVYPSRRKSFEDYISSGRIIKNNVIKKRLIRDGYFIHECYECRGQIWLGKPIPIELHHIDGNNQNNTLSNLQLLCPNCHAQTDTYCGKNKKNKYGTSSKRRNQLQQ